MRPVYLPRRQLENSSINLGLALNKVLLKIAGWQISDTTQLLTTSNFIGPWYHAALLFSGLGSIVLLFVLLFSQQIREDLVRAAYANVGGRGHTRRLAGIFAESPV